MRKLAYVAIVFALLGVAYAQKDTRALRPPKGAAVAIVVFEDLQCPDCARAHPLLKEAAATYKIPLVTYDFPLPIHNWSFDAAVMARYFRSLSPKLEEEFRDLIFANQPAITPQNLRGMVEKFAAERGVQLPFVMDPRGDLERKVRADYQLGQATGIQHTPTIYVVSNSRRGAPFVEVVDRRQLFGLIDDMLKRAEPVKASSPPKGKATARKQ